MNSIGNIDIDNSIFILIDIQEKFVPHIFEIDRVINNANILLKGSEILEVPTIITEQYPKGLGNTCDKLNIDFVEGDIIEKTAFDCFNDDTFAETFYSYERENIIIYGIESHVCVLQTALSAIEENFNVHVIKDAVSSRTQENWELGIERMRQSKTFIASTEMILFQLLKSKEANGFKEISNLVK